MLHNPPRSAPRLDASPSSLAAFASRRVGILQRCRRSLDPTYNWGRASISSVDERGEGFGRFFMIDFLGLHLNLTIGFTPKAVR